MSTLHRDERGIALASAIFLGVVMVLITAVMITRALGQSDADFASREFDQALHVAEGGLDFGITELNANAAFNTGHSASEFTDRETVIALADAMPDTAVISTPDGEFVLLGATDAQVLISVGYVPSRDATERFVRVVRSGVQQFAYVMNGALTIGGPTKLKGKEPGKKGDIEFFGDPGVVTINGDLEFDWKNEIWQGCMTALGIKDDEWTGPYSNELGDQCPDQDRVEPAPIPDLNPRPFFKSAHYVICPDGVHYGPGGSTTDMYGWTKTSARGGPTELLPPGMYGPNVDYVKLNDPKNGNKYADKLTMAEMCSGAWIGAEDKVTLGIDDGLQDPDKKIKFKDKKNDTYGPEDGVYYMIGRSAEVKIEDWQHVYMSIIAEKHGNERECWGGPDSKPPKVWLTNWKGETKLYDQRWETNGDFKLEAGKGASLEAHPDAGHIVIFTGGDIEMKIKGDVKKEDQGFVHGLIFANEQAKLESTDIEPDPVTGVIENGALQGGVLIADACDSKESRLDKNEVKKGDFVYDSAMTVPELTPPGANYGVSFTNEM